MMTAERTVVFSSAAAEAVNRHVSDCRKLAAIQADPAGLLAVDQAAALADPS